MSNKFKDLLIGMVDTMYAMDPLASRVIMNNARLSREEAKQKANYLPYGMPSSPIATFGSQANPLGLAKNIPPLPDVSSLKGIKGNLPFSTSLKPVTNVDSYSYPLSLPKDMSPLPDASSEPELLQIKQNQFPEPISTKEPQKSVPPQQGVIPNQSAGFQQSFWDHLRSREFLQRLSDYGIGYALSDGTVAQSLASGAMNLRRGDMEREKSNQVNQTVEYLKSKGYSEEEARVMASNPQMLSALLTGGDKPKLSVDYQLITNPETGEYEAKIIKGSKTYDEIQQREQLKKLQIVDAQIMKESMKNTINEAIKILKTSPELAAGKMGQFLQNLWNTPAASLKGHLESIRSGVMLQKLALIRSISGTGASGLGPLSDKEGVKLENVYLSIQQSNNPKELIRNLERLQEIYSKVTNAQLSILINDNISPSDILAAFGSKAQHSIDSPTLTGKYAGVSFITTNEEVQKLPKGSKFAFLTNNGIKIYER
ncbi:hypothetical protein [Bartonella raoultii]|uniref:Uncharacterized protein n=1 Tax=Bartonella raoultii TaxID=1457020 RepID=A0ABS7I5J0_9HYPH|nr:hypothetical protein [Bartonella raoultii]MBX4335612.1 hypothetical protein [Bartonella raoultii]